MTNFCIECGKEKNGRGKRCRSCAAKERWKNPTEKMLDAHIKQLEDLHKLPRTEKQIKQIKERQKAGTEASAKLPRTEKQLEASRESIGKAQEASAKMPRTEKQFKQIKEMQKAGIEASAKLPRTEKQLEASRENVIKMHEKNAKNYNYVSRPEQAFFELLCSQNPDLIILQQQYLKGLNHPFDIMIPELKILIEVDGDYTHSRPGRKERDAEINEFVWRTYPDWQLFRFDDEDLRKLKKLTYIFC